MPVRVYSAPKPSVRTRSPFCPRNRPCYSSRVQPNNVAYYTTPKQIASMMLTISQVPSYDLSVGPASSHVTTTKTELATMYGAELYLAYIFYPYHTHAITVTGYNLMIPSLALRVRSDQLLLLPSRKQQGRRSYFRRSCSHQSLTDDTITHRSISCRSVEAIHLGAVQCARYTNPFANRKLNEHRRSQGKSDIPWPSHSTTPRFST
mmetsp:Transcript_39881/g.72996  ORF Transcript_39881/g.72996 Transcript_39881/m.72996 type:complete len:206 (+) Transcript_39881:1262-1879(+)